MIKGVAGRVRWEPPAGSVRESFFTVEGALEPQTETYTHPHTDTDTQTHPEILLTFKTELLVILPANNGLLWE